MNPSLKTEMIDIFLKVIDKKLKLIDIFFEMTDMLLQLIDKPLDIEQERGFAIIKTPDSGSDACIIDKYFINK